MSRCKHFTGVQNATCNVGIFYTTVRDPTQEEIDAEERAFNAAFDNVAAARRAIVAVTSNKRGVSGETKCPVCSGGTLRYSVARSNGHILAACSTATCVRWME